MYPGSKFSSGSLAHGASAAQFQRAKLLKKGHIAAEPVQLRQISPRSLNSSVLKSSTAQLRLGSLGASSTQAV